MNLIVFVCLLKLMVPLVEASTERAKCKDVACPSPEACPDDSELKPVTKHYSNHFHHHLDSYAKDFTRNKRALAYGGRQRETIKIIPGAYDHHNRKRSITDDEMLLLHCCTQYECVCKPNYCDQECPANKIPANTTNPTEKFGVPGNCCVPCKDSYCIHDRKYRKHGDRWSDDECTNCACEYGKVNCQTSLCKASNCLKYKQVPGECCPVCDEDDTNFCADVRYCNMHCRYGYLRQGDCDLCQCARPPANGVIHTSVVHPEIKTTTENTTDSVAGTEDIVRKGPHKNNSYGVFFKQILIYLASFSVALISIIGVIVYYCYRNNAKYDAVQV